jgi:DNA-binding NarL/FixJ family response regulator
MMHRANASTDFRSGGTPADVSAALLAQSHMHRGAPVGADRITVLLADDHTLFREGLRVLLRSAPEIEVVGEAENGDRAVAVAARVVPDVVVLDLDMPGSDGAAALRGLRTSAPSARVLVLTVYPEHASLLPVLKLGARGYLTKDAAVRELVDAIRVVAAGEVYVRPSAARALATAVASPAHEPAARASFDVLSDREQSTLRGVASGYSGVEIARELGVSSKTVDAYKRRIRDKLGLVHRSDFVRFAVEAGLLGATSQGLHRPL